MKPNLKVEETVLVTGGAGFIGSFVCEALLAQNCRVLAVDNLSTGLRANLKAIEDQIEFIEGNVADETLIGDLVCRADRVIHLAASVGNRLVSRKPLEAIENNLRATSHLLAACARYARPVLLASSSEVYGRCPQLPFREDADLVLGNSTSPRWLYAISKLTNEFEAMAYHRQNDLPVVVARFFNIAGPRQRSRYGMVLPRFVRQALSGKPLTVYGDGSQVRCFCHVETLAPALIRLLQTPAANGCIVNLGSDRRVTILELAQRVKQRIATASPIEHLPFGQIFGPDYDDMLCRQPDISVARKLIGFTPGDDLDAIIDDVVAYQRAEWERLRGEHDY